jgi:vacuolar-type H+-ATPase subunit H
VSDGWMKARTKGQHREGEHDDARVTALPGLAPPPPVAQLNGQLNGQPEGPAGDVPQALQMLTLAQRTADEHVASALRQADKIQADAHASAEHILRDAAAQAESVRQQADEALADARSRAERAAREIQSSADKARQDGEKVVAEARADADRITQEARTRAESLDRQAKQRYDEEVGNLAAKRAALQQQIEALQEFDRDYRSRLLTFMQAQLRALWVEQPQVDGELPADALPTPRPEPEPAHS